MQIIQVDGLDRDAIADILVLSELSKKDGLSTLKNLQENEGSDYIWFSLVEDDYRLSRGMEDLI